MDTKIIVLEQYKKTGALGAEDREKLQSAAEILKQGGLVAFPTETVYGLGGDALKADVSKRIYAAKGRPSDNPLIVHISSIEQLYEVAAEVSPEALQMAKSYWPGPLTMVFRKAPCVPDETTGGLDTVAVRFPSHPAANALIAYSGTVIAAPSANLSGRPSTTSAAHCIEDLSGRVDAIVDGGDSEIGLESTILDVSGEMPQLLRPGAVTLEMIEQTLGRRITEDVAVKGPLAEGIRPKAPGMKYRHYAPKAPMVLVAPAAKSAMPDASASDFFDPIAAELRKLLEQHTAVGERTALLCSDECLAEIRKSAPAVLETVIVKTIGSRSEQGQMAHVLFDRLRDMDAEEVDFIAAEGCAEENIGRALMNRMKKAAAWQVIFV